MEATDIGTPAPFTTDQFVELLPDSPTFTAEEKEPCTDCPPTLSLDEFKERFPTDHDVLCAILAELIMLRGSLTDMASGLSEIGSIGLGGMLGSLFGRKD